MVCLTVGIGLRLYPVDFGGLEMGRVGGRGVGGWMGAEVEVVVVGVRRWLAVLRWERFDSV